MANDDDAAQDPRGAGSPPQFAGTGLGSTTTAPKEPGWYPVRTNPNEQTYWDGRDWTGRRRWSAGSGWTEVGAGPLVAPAGPGTFAPAPRFSANPYAPHPAATTTPATRSLPGVTLGLLLLIFSAVAMMAGSVTTWVSTTSAFGGGTAPHGILGIGQSVSAATSGVDAGVSGVIGINGFITLIVAAVVLVFAGLMAVSDDRSVRLVGCLFAVLNLGLAIYAVVRLMQKINQAHAPRGVSVSLGWGVILLLATAVVATLITLYEVSQNR